MKKIAGLVVAMVALIVFSDISKAAIHVYGKPDRVTAVTAYLKLQGAQDVLAHPGAEIMGSFKGKPWPGVNVSTTATNDGGQGIFIPVSNNALKEGLCSDQEALLRTFVPPPAPAKKAPAKDLYAGMVPASSMRTIQSGDSCDERSFSGMVTKGALEASGGQTVDVLELHRRAGKSMEYKAKRLRVDALSGIAIPMVWSSDGSCVRKYSEQSLTESELRTLLSTSESLRSTTVSDIAKKNFGAHLTEGVYVIYPIN